MQTLPQPLPQAVRWTRAEYARLTDDGYFAGRRVQLIGGEIVEMPAMKGPHAVAIEKVGAALRRAAGSGYWVRQQLPLALGEYDEPEPDTAVVPGEPDDYIEEHPGTAVLVVEISDTTLAFDRGRKQEIYAWARIAEYWIVNLVDRVLEVYREPMAAETSDTGWRYARREVLVEDQAVSPLRFPAARVVVRQLLPREQTREQ